MSQPTEPTPWIENSDRVDSAAVNVLTIVFMTVLVGLILAVVGVAGFIALRAIL